MTAWGRANLRVPGSMGQGCAGGDVGRIYIFCQPAHLSAPLANSSGSPLTGARPRAIPTLRPPCSTPFSAVISTDDPDLRRPASPRTMQREHMVRISSTCPLLPCKIHRASSTASPYELSTPPHSRRHEARSRVWPGTACSSRMLRLSAIAAAQQPAGSLSGPPLDGHRQSQKSPTGPCVGSVTGLYACI